MKKEEANWVVVYMTRRRDEAENARGELTREGFLAHMFPEDGQSASGAFEIKCLMSEAREAREYLTEKGFF